jgi:hypothetical protein
MDDVDWVCAGGLGWVLGGGEGEEACLRGWMDGWLEGWMGMWLST